MNFLSLCRSVLCTTASSETLDVSQEGKEVLVFVTGAADVTISSFHRAFHAPYCKIEIGLDRIGLDWIRLVTRGYAHKKKKKKKNVIANKMQGRINTLQFP